jgi:hypothetical protein
MPSSDEQNEISSQVMEIDDIDFNVIKKPRYILDSERGMYWFYQDVCYFVVI